MYSYISATLHIYWQLKQYHEIKMVEFKMFSTFILKDYLTEGFSFLWI